MRMGQGGGRQGRGKGQRSAAGVAQNAVHQGCGNAVRRGGVRSDERGRRSGRGKLRGTRCGGRGGTYDN